MKDLVIVTVRHGCAEVYSCPDSMDVIIVDQDGDFPFYCNDCENYWGPADWPDWDDTTHPDLNDDDLLSDTVILTCHDCVKERENL